MPACSACGMPVIVAPRIGEDPGCPFIPEGAGRCQAGFGLRFRGCVGVCRACGNSPVAPPFSRAGARFRASGRAGSRTGRSPAAGGGAGGVLDAGAREPMIEACGERALRFRVRVYAVVVAPRPACGRAACWLHSSLRLCPGVPGGHGAGSRRAGRGQSQGRPRRRGAGGRMNGGLAPGRRPGQVMRPARAGEHGGRRRRASRRRPGSAAPGRRRPWRCSWLPCRGGR
jgi:hypothetical protein